MGPERRTPNRKAAKGHLRLGLLLSGRDCCRRGSYHRLRRKRRAFPGIQQPHLLLARVESRPKDRPRTEAQPDMRMSGHRHLSGY
jgi:hypothetical protein